MINYQYKYESETEREKKNKMRDEKKNNWRSYLQIVEKLVNWVQELEFA